MLSAADSASAATIFFNSRAAWEAAVTGETTETYESYAWNSSSSDSLGSGATLGNFSYSGPVIYGVNSLAVTYDAPYLQGNYLEWQSGSPNTLGTVVLTGNVSAIGFDYGEFYGSVVPMTLSLGNGDSISAMTNPNAYAFLGAISTASFNSFTITGNPYPLIDNLSVANASAAPVPEPSSMLLLGTGIAAVLAAGRRQRLTRRA